MPKDKSASYYHIMGLIRIMINIINHILVDIDDGPKTIEKSIALLTS